MSTHPLFAGIGGHQTPKRNRTDDWLTPPHIIPALGGWESFDLDPAAIEDQIWPTARQHYTIRDNGLILPWHGRVWLNPPYSRGPLRKFMARMAAHGRGIAFIFARTDTETFHAYGWERADAMLFLHGRTTFYTPDGKPARRKDGSESNGGAPTVLIAYSQAEADVLANCGLRGKFVPLKLPRSVVVLALEPTWRQAVLDVLRVANGPVRLDDLYRAMQGHAKAQKNQHWQAKVRQTVQLVGKRVGRGVWRAA